jgi:hypothetical protein
MTSQQRVIWTACPNGVAPTGKVRISVAVAPQLLATTAQPTLADFPDFEDWPATKIKWNVNISGHVVNGKVVSTASPSLYKAFFHPKTPVAVYEYHSPANNSLISYPASFMRGFYADTYAGLAGKLPADGGLHDFGTLLRESPLRELPLNSRELNDLITSVKNSLPSSGPISLDKTLNVPTALGLAKIFTTPPLPPPPQGNGPAIEPAIPKPPKVPNYDFHNAYSLLQRHPALLRLFGFVIDLEVTLPHVLLPKVADLSVTPVWNPKLGAGNTTNITPITKTAIAGWLPAPRPVSPEIADGLFRLSDPGAYDVLDVDVDGAMTKTLNFVQAVFNATGPMRSADTPTRYGMPSLRSAGLSLSKIGHGDSLYQNWLNNNSFQTALSSNPPQQITLFAEDIAQGYRIDVWEKSTNRWFQLCARSAAPKPVGVGGYGIGKPQKVVPVPNGDEGWLEPAVTHAPNTTLADFPPLYLPETLFRWNGWSLVGPRPGKHLTDNSTGDLADETGNKPQADSHFQVQIDYVATPGTLPTLRFGHAYRFKARVVDLAGNSVPFEPHGPLAHTTSQTVYGRVEPLASPVIVPCAPKTAGESLERLVIRSNYDIPNTSPLIVPCERHLAPPSSSIEMLEAHGVLDDSHGVPSKAAYATLADRDGLTYKSPSVIELYGGKVEKLNAHNEWIYYPPGQPHRPPFGVPYLPDFLSGGVTLFGLPGVEDQYIQVSSDLGAWPDRRALRLVVRAGQRLPSLPTQKNLDGAITVYAPKATVTTVRLSSWFPGHQLGAMKIWQWLEAAGLATPQLQQHILHGGHYMLTPFRELVIVHAVRQPLTAPVVKKLTPERHLNKTYAFLNGSLQANSLSTQRVDVLSVYTDPYDDGSNPLGAVTIVSKSRVHEFPREANQSDVIDVKNMRQDFGNTKHHEVYYHLLATTRFLEYFTQTATVKLTGTAPHVVSHKGFATGTVIVKGTGKHVADTYREGVDFTEDDSRGSIARIAKGSIPNGEDVQVQFVPPPVTRSSLEKDAHPPTPSGYLVSIPNATRPPVPDVRYVIPTFAWKNEKPPKKNSSPVSIRGGNHLRVYLGRPWFETGVGELLGVVVGDPPPGLGIPANLQPFVSGCGSDPVFLTANVPLSLSVADFKIAVHRGKGVLLEEQSGTTPLVDIAGHVVSWDPERQLWFSDIEISVGEAYFPFVKLALVRYQPSSLHGIEVSRVIQTDFIQMAPDRTLSLTYPSSRTVDVVVTGPGYVGTTDAGTNDTMRAYVQEELVATSDPDLRWATVPSQPSGVVLTQDIFSASLTTWKGKLTLPTPRGTKKYRIAVAEFEEHKVRRSGNEGSRVTYLDAIEI